MGSLMDMSLTPVSGSVSATSLTTVSESGSAVASSTPVSEKNIKENNMAPPKPSFASLQTARERKDSYNDQKETLKLEFQAARAKAMAVSAAKRQAKNDEQQKLR